MRMAQRKGTNNSESCRTDKVWTAFLTFFLSSAFAVIILHSQNKDETAMSQKNPLHIPSPFQVGAIDMTPEQKEQEYVHNVYQVIAPHFSATRYKASSEYLLFDCGSCIWIIFMSQAKRTCGTTRC